ncbi:putative disease resistance protein, partial [Mucuna pruriens]
SNKGSTLLLLALTILPWHHASKKHDVFLSFGGEDTRRNFTSYLHKALNEEKLLECIMAEQLMMSGVAAASKKYEVFLSFRGEDTRRNFTSHLYKDLNKEKVKTYIDEQIEKGDEISEVLSKAIEESHVSVVIFSENYASSKWCLNELSKILECRKEKGQIVIPVFYNIDPSHVKNQTGSYEKAFAKHEGEVRCNKWKDALTEAANLAGWDSRTYRTDPELLKDIVGDVLGKLPPRYKTQRKGLVGVEEHYKQIESLLKIRSSEVRTLGIWGMGGIGKTALANALYDELSHEFEGCCFLTKVVDKSEMSRLRGKRVFIVLDDVATSEQFEKLIGEFDFLGPGSRVVVTTRNIQILSPVDEIYLVQELSYHYSLQLFCLTVFGEKQPKDGYEDLSTRVISYCKGIPLALKVLGASLRKASKEVWECELRKLQKIPNMEIHNTLKLSYDGLDCSQKEIFLDLACFFKGVKRDWVTGLLEAFGFFPASGIQVLLDKALITISRGKWIEMHDLTQEMGREIVHQECMKDPGRRSRLYKHEEVLHVLKHNKGSDVVEGIILDLHKLTEDLYLSSDSFAMMINLRFLQIHKGWWSDNKFNVYLRNGLESLSDKLRYLHWDECCLESLPSNFCAEHLVELCMPRSKLKKLWDGVQNLVSLKTIDLWDSQDLIEIPNLYKAEKLERVYLNYCKSLQQLHVHSKSLVVLALLGCSSLKKISVTSEEMKELDLSYTAIRALSSSIGHLLSLETLELSGTNVDILPAKMKHLSMMRKLKLDDHCKKLVSLPELPASLRELHLNNCWKLVSLPKLPPSLKEVSAFNCISLKTDITQRLVLQHMLHQKYLYSRAYIEGGYFIFPGSHVMDECRFHTKESSITIPYLPKSHLCGFIYCIVLSEGPVLKEHRFSCAIYRDDILLSLDRRRFIGCTNLISDHVLFWYHDISKFGGMNEAYDHFRHMTFIFKFNHNRESIKGCGVLWDDLTERFTKGNHFRISNLLHEIHSVKHGKRSVSEFFTDLKIVWKELEALKAIPNCTCAAKNVIKLQKESEYVICFLKGLGETYGTIEV